MNVIHADRAIAKKLLSGDENAFRDLFDSYFPRLYRFALVRVDGNQDEAHEMVQQTFCKAFERLDSYRGEASLYGWMCQICRNTITDMGRRRQREYRRYSRKTARSREFWKRLQDPHRRSRRTMRGAWT